MKEIGEVTTSGQEDLKRECPVFGIKSGSPLIGLGILLILFAIIPFFLIRGSIPGVIVILFISFGIFLIRAGIKK